MGDQAVLRSICKTFIESKDLPLGLADFMTCYEAAGDLCEEIWKPKFDREYVRQLMRGKSARQAMAVAAEYCKELIMNLAVKSEFMTENERKGLNQSASVGPTLTLSEPVKGKVFMELPTPQSGATVTDCDERSVAIKDSLGNKTSSAHTQKTETAVIHYEGQSVTWKDFQVCTRTKDDHCSSVRKEPVRRPKAEDHRSMFSYAIIWLETRVAKQVTQRALTVRSSLKRQVFAVAIPVGKNAIEPRKPRSSRGPNGTIDDSQNLSIVLTNAADKDCVTDLARGSLATASDKKAVPPLLLEGQFACDSWVPSRHRQKYSYTSLWMSEILSVVLLTERDLNSLICSVVKVTTVLNCNRHKATISQLLNFQQLTLQVSADKRISTYSMFTKPKTSIHTSVVGLMFSNTGIHSGQLRSSIDASVSFQNMCRFSVNAIPAKEDSCITKDPAVKPGCGNETGEESACNEQEIALNKEAHVKKRKGLFRRIGRMFTRLFVCGRVDGRSKIHKRSENK